MGSMSLLFAASICILGLMSTVLSSTPYSRSLNDVGFSVVKELGTEGNQFVSPMSIYLAMAMTHLGAKAKTKEQLEEALKLRYRGVPTSELHLNSKYLISLYSGNAGEYNLSLANGMFVQDGYPLSKGFIGNFKSLYQGAIKPVDFAQNGEDAKSKINYWVSMSTQNSIPEFLASPLDPSTVLALVNAIHFKGTWKTQFDPKNTVVGTFYAPNNQEREVSLMTLRGESFNYYEDSETGYKFLEMPYNGQHLSMFLALPMDESKYPDLEMTNEILYRITRKVKNTKLVKVIVPKFRMEYHADLKEAFKAMGVQDLFTSDADLSRISDRRDLRVSSVQHKAVVEVNEEGSEAAAVTGVIIEPKSASGPPKFVANRPFLFYIVDKRFDIVLFAGRLVDP